MNQKRYFDQNGMEKKKFTVTVTRNIDDGFGNHTVETIEMDTWAISDKKAISNIRYRRNKSGALNDYPGKGAVIESYKAVPA